MRMHALTTQARSVWGIFKVRDAFLWGPKGYNISGSVLGSSYVGKLPYQSVRMTSHSYHDLAVCLAGCTVICLRE